MIRKYRYSCEEHDYLLVDGRSADVPRFRKNESVHALCLIHEAEGIAILDYSEKADFKLEYHGIFHPGIQACAVAYADLLGIKAFHTQDYTFESEGAVHKATIESHLGECKTVRLDEATEAFSVLCLGSLE